MKKAIKIISLISFCIAILACVLAIVFLTVFWEPVCLMFYNSTEIVEMGPIIPVDSIVYLFSCLGASTILIASHKLRKTIILDVILVICLSIVIPVLSWQLSIIQHISVSSGSVMKYTSFSVTRQIVNYLLSLINVSKCLCFVICGMRIATATIYNNIESGLGDNK